MQLSSLPLPVLEKVRAYQWDGIVEKHEGPFDYGSFNRFMDPEFMTLSGFNVLLPVGRVALQILFLSAKVHHQLFVTRRHGKA